MLQNFHDITNVLFINLDSRTDRRTHFELQFFEIDFIRSALRLFRMRAVPLGAL